MRFNNFIFATILTSLLISCSNEENKVESKNTPRKEDHNESLNEPDLAAEDLEPVDFDTTLLGKDYFKGKEDLLSKLKSLASDAKTIPFYFIQGSDHYFISSDQNEKEEFYELNPSMRFGLIQGDSNVLLKTEYEKIYNPNFTAKNCVEFRKGSLNGLLNFKTGQKTEPYFDYIIPQRNQKASYVYANRFGKWYSIDVSTMEIEKLTDFDAKKGIGKTKLMDVNNPATWVIRTVVGEEGYLYGSNIIVVPSFLNKTKAMGNDYYPGFIPSSQKEANFGTDELRMSIEDFRVLNKNVISFVSNSYIEELDARGYQSERQYLTVMNIINNQIATVGIGSSGDYNYWCDALEYQFLSDSLLEIHISGQDYKKKSYGYDFETIYDYYVISKEGEVKQAETYRKFSFTKFADIDETYFQGCYGKFLETDDYDQNLLQTKHLSIEDLDVMRNEIFAEYGYKFKSEKWQEYFGKFEWYKPQFDNVDDQLTERDKANIDVILSVKKKMEGNEDAFTKPEKTGYSAAG